MTSALILLCVSLPFLQYTLAALVPQGYQYNPPTAGGGFNYNRPSAPAFQLVNTGHHFPAALPTIRPIPAVPQLPSLPTARPNVQLQTQTLLQVHPPASLSQSIASAYRPANAQNTPTSYSTVRPRLAQNYDYTSSVPSVTAATPAFGQRLAAPTPTASTAPQHFTYPEHDDAPPLRIPFGKQAVITPITGAGNEQNNNFNQNRLLHQYAVVEIIDNDIEPSKEPFLNSNFFDTYRAHIGASGTGAQIESRADALVLEQQRLAQQSSGLSRGDAVALGSGSLGYIRLPNGNVYLGSGSLGYISGQQRSASIQEARTRTGAPVPDPLHFGHGPYGNPLDNRFRFRF